MVVTLVNPKVTVMSLDDGLLKLTGKLKTPPSTIVASPMVTTGAASSSKMVPMAFIIPLAMVNVSSNSSIVSWVVGTLTVPVVAPAGTTTVTLVVV